MLPVFVFSIVPSRSSLVTLGPCVSVVLYSVSAISAGCRLTNVPDPLTTSALPVVYEMSVQSRI